MPRVLLPTESTRVLRTIFPFSDATPYLDWAARKATIKYVIEPFQLLRLRRQGLGLHLSPETTARS